jgi:hypothetical protein
MAEKPPIFIKGPSGSGKDYSLRNLDPKTTVLINVEDKPGPYKYPFANTRVKPKNSSGQPDNNYFFITFMKLFRKCLENPDMKVVVVNSFTSFIERLYTEASGVYSDFDVWSYYNKCITDVLRATKQAEGKYVVWTGIDDNIVGQSGIQANKIFVQGKVWYGKVEKEFTMILQTHVQESSEGVQYQFITNRVAGFTSSDLKSPPGLLPERMENDLAKVIELCEKIYTDEPDEPKAKAVKTEETAPEVEGLEPELPVG